MEIVEVYNRTENLINELVEIWEDSVRATYTFWTNEEIEKIKEYVPQAIKEVSDLVIIKDENNVPVGFMGIEEQKLEMLFIKNNQRGKGLGKQLLNYGIEYYCVNELTVNEQNPEAKGFYEYLGFRTYKRSEIDEQGNPYPILYMRLDNYEEMYNNLVNKSLALVEELGKRRNYKIPENKKGQYLFLSIQSYFEKNFIEDCGVYYLMKELIEWNRETEENFSDKIRIRNIAIRYDIFKDKFKHYEEVENEIIKYGVEKVKEEREEKYRKQFKEFFERKNSDEQLDIVKLINKIILKEYDLSRLNDVEKIIQIEKTYKYIMRLGYKKVARMYS